MSAVNPEDMNFMIEQIRDQAVRREITKHSHLFFFHIYFSHFVQYEMAPFHQDLFAITEDPNIPLAAIVAFRGSAKSTIMTLSYALWSILGVQQKKFVVIISQTQEQAKQHFRNIKNELESNTLLKADLGPFREEEWNSGSIILPKYNAKIMAASYDQGIRGFKHGPYRPGLIIADDIEDTNSTKTIESRDKTYNWFTKEILPIGDKNTRFIVIGNLLHNDSLIIRLKNEIDNKERTGIFKEYPLIDENNNCLWPGKYPNAEEIEKERLKIGNKYSWHQEYLLKIIDTKEAVVQREWIHYYRDIPENGRSASYAIGIDLAISEREEGDFTAMVAAKVFRGEDGNRIVYILPNPINEKLSFPSILTRIKGLVNDFGGKFSTTIYVEEAFLQGYLTQFLDDNNYQAEGFKVHGMDKKARLQMTTHHIQTGKILFPEKGADELIKQILDFRVTKHDDLVDAFTTMCLKIIEKDGEPQPNIRIIETPIYRRGLSS